MTDAHWPVGDGEAARALGRLEAQVAAIEDRIARLETSSAMRMAAVEQKLDSVVTSLAQSQGALKLVHWLGGIAVAAGGFVASLLLRPPR